MERHSGTARSRLVAAVCGAVLVSCMMGGIGARSGNAVLGGAAGAVLGATLGYGSAAGTISTITLGALLVAIFACLIGPGVDDYGGHSAVPAAVFGGIVGWFFRRRRPTRA